MQWVKEIVSEVLDFLDGLPVKSRIHLFVFVVIMSGGWFFMDRYFDHVEVLAQTQTSKPSQAPDDLKENKTKHFAVGIETDEIKTKAESSITK